MKKYIAVIIIVFLIPVLLNAKPVTLACEDEWSKKNNKGYVTNFIIDSEAKTVKDYLGKEMPSEWSSIDIWFGDAEGIWFLLVRDSLKLWETHIGNHFLNGTYDCKIAKQKI